VCPCPPRSRTLTSLLASSGADPGELGRSQSVPGVEGPAHASLRPAIVSQPLEATHPEAAVAAPPAMEHSESEPMPRSQPLDRSALKAFDPLAVMSPVPSVPTRSLPPLHTSPGNPPAALGVDTVSSINSYSSAALSSGTFTAISVSPVSQFTPGGLQLPTGTPGSSPYVPVSGTQPAGAVQSGGETPVSRAAEFLATASITSVSSSSSGGDSTASVSQSSAPSISVDLSAVHSSNAAAAMSVTSTSSPSIHTPMMHPSPPASNRSAVSFRDVDTTIHEDGRVTSTRAQAARHERELSMATDGTPSAVRVHGEEEPSPANYPHISPARAATAAAHASTAPVSVPASAAASEAHDMLSPSQPKSTLTTRSSGSDSEADVLSPSHGQDSPLPPVVSALMAAQKMAGTTPGATLAMPVKSQLGRLIMLVGDASGAGKSSVAMGLLHLLLKRGYQPSELAYIKPCTQCEDVQIVSKYCEKMGIQHQGLGPVIFYEGFTAEVIEGKTESVDKRRARVQKAVNKIAEGKKWVLVDGVGYAAVGSVAGVSNAEVASLLNAPVLTVGRPGVGNAIDAMNFILAYFEKYHVHMVGACWNKLPPMHSYHSYAQCKKYVTKYFREIRNGVISCYGHIPLVEMKPSPSAASADSAADPASPPSDQVTCRLRPAKTDLALSEAEERFVAEFLATMEREFDIEQMLSDLNKYYQAHRLQLVSVV